MSERRKATRRHGAGLLARMRPGYRVAIVDVSMGGALLEAGRPLHPGADVELQFERADGRVRIFGTVVRCTISALHPHTGPTYRAAISFADTFEWARETPTQHGQCGPARPLA